MAFKRIWKGKENQMSTIILDKKINPIKKNWHITDKVSAVRQKISDTLKTQKDTTHKIKYYSM